MTPEEALKETQPLGNSQKIKEFLLTASPRDIQKFIHGTAPLDYNQFFNLAKVALDIQLAEQQIRLAEEQSKSAKILEHETVMLIELTRGLKRLNWVLIYLTTGLLVFSILFSIFDNRSHPQEKGNNPSQQKAAP